MKTVLIVDNDRLTLEELSRPLAARADELKVFTARQGREALEILASHPVDILITELVMPVMDGFELIGLVLNRYPSIDIVVMEDGTWGRVGQALRAQEDFYFLEKPVVAQRVLDVIREISGPARGRIAGLSLAGFLQLLSTEHRTCSLTVRSGSRQAHIDLQRGQVVNARSGGVEGKRALFEMLSWDQPAIEVDDTPATTTVRIDQALSTLLLEAAHYQDQRHADAVDTAELLPRETSQPESREVSFELDATAQLAPYLEAFLDLEGTVGVALVDLAEGQCLAHAAGDDYPEFADRCVQATQEVDSVADADLRRSLRQMKFYRGRQYHLLRFFAAEPNLVLFYAGLVGQGDAAVVGERLAELENSFRGFDLAAPN